MDAILTDSHLDKTNDEEIYPLMDVIVHELLRGTIVNRTYGMHKNLSVETIFANNIGSC